MIALYLSFSVIRQEITNILSFPVKNVLVLTEFFLSFRTVNRVRRHVERPIPTGCHVDL
jgi:hypothetical protein